MHIAQLETDFRTKHAAAVKLLKDTMLRCDEHRVEATATTPAILGRLMTDEERTAINAATKDAEDLRAKIDRARGDGSMQAALDKLLAGVDTHATSPILTPSSTFRSMGEQFAADPGYRAFIAAAGHRRSGGWTSPGVETFGQRYGATLVTTDPASMGKLIQPDILPGVQMLPFYKLVVADLPAPGTTTSNLIQYMKEKTFTNAAAAVLEGGTKPESTLVFDSATSPVHKIAHWIPVTEEALEDYAQLQSIIDARLRDGLARTEEDELLNGSGVAPHLLGYLTLPGLAPAQPMGTDTPFDAIFKQIIAIQTNALATPDAVVMNPANFAGLQLAKNAQGNYLGSGPWAGPQTPVVWGLPVAVTPAIAAGTALVGAYRTMSQLFRKGGIRVEATNAHSTFFVENKVAIRAEERLALAVYREAAFGKVTGLT